MIVCRLFEYSWSSSWKLRMEVGNLKNAKKQHDQRAKISYKPPMVFQHREKIQPPEAGTHSRLTKYVWRHTVLSF